MSPAAPRLLCPTLVGRDEELATLGELLESARAGQGRTALVAGEAGIGKSALLRRFADAARAAGARVEVGECTEIEARRPLGPLISVAEHLRGQGRLRSLSGELTFEDATPDDATVHRAYQRFAATLIELARAVPLVIAVEDLHWADAATLELFVYLARRLRQERVLLVGTYRSDELHRRHPLRPVLAELGRARLVDEVTLARLDRADASVLLRDTLRLDREPPSALTDAIQEQCEGNPYFIEEVLRALEQHGDLVYRHGRWEQTKDVLDLRIPDTVRDAIDARLGPLDPSARGVLQVAAVIGQHFDFDLLRAVTGMDEDTLTSALGAAIEAQLVQFPSKDRTFAFRHALTRESILADVFEPERRRLHLAVARALETNGDHEALADELAYHFDAANDRAKAYDYHLLAADAALRMPDPAQASRHLERAVALAPADADVAALYLRLADTEALRGSVHAAPAADEAARRLTSEGRTREAGRALTSSRKPAG